LTEIRIADPASKDECRKNLPSVMFKVQHAKEDWIQPMTIFGAREREKNVNKLRSIQQCKHQNCAAHYTA